MALPETRKLPRSKENIWRSLTEGKSDGSLDENHAHASIALEDRCKALRDHAS